MWQFILIPIGLQSYNMFHFQIISIVLNQIITVLVLYKKWRRSYQGGGGGSYQRILAEQIRNFKSIVLTKTRTVALL